MAVTTCPDRQHRWIRSRKYSHEFTCGICKATGVKPIRVSGRKYRMELKPWEQGLVIVVCHGIDIPEFDELYLE